MNGILYGKSDPFEAAFPQLPLVKGRDCIAVLCYLNLAEAEEAIAVLQVDFISFIDCGVFCVLQTEKQIKPLYPVRKITAARTNQNKNKKAAEIKTILWKITKIY